MALSSEPSGSLRTSGLPNQEPRICRQGTIVRQNPSRPGRLPLAVDWMLNRLRAKHGPARSLCGQGLLQVARSSLIESDPFEGSMNNQRCDHAAKQDQADVACRSMRDAGLAVG